MNVDECVIFHGDLGNKIVIIVKTAQPNRSLLGSCRVLAVDWRLSDFSTTLLPNNEIHNPQKKTNNNYTLKNENNSPYHNSLRTVKTVLVF